MKKFFCIFFLCFLSLIFAGNALGVYKLEIDCIGLSYYQYAPELANSSSFKIHVRSWLYRPSKKGGEFREDLIFLADSGYSARNIKDSKESRELCIKLLKKCFEKKIIRIDNGKINKEPKVFEISEDLYNQLLNCSRIFRKKTKSLLSENLLSQKNKAFDFYFDTVMKLLDSVN